MSSSVSFPMDELPLSTTGVGGENKSSLAAKSDTTNRSGVCSSDINDNTGSVGGNVQVSIDVSVCDSSLGCGGEW